MAAIFIFLWGAQSQSKIADNKDNKLRVILGGTDKKTFSWPLSVLAVGEGETERR